MRYKKLILTLTGTVFAAACVLQSQSRQQTDPDSYAALMKIVEEQFNTTSNTNRDAAFISAYHKKALAFLDGLPLSGKEKTRFLIDHINSELIEIEKRQSIVKLMLSQLPRQGIQQDQLQQYSKFFDYQHSHPSTGTALFYYLISLEDNGTAVFNDPVWTKIVGAHLERGDASVSTLTDHVLEAAEREHWHPYGTVLPEWSDNEKHEMGNAVVRAQRNLLAQRYIQEKGKR